MTKKEFEIFSMLSLNENAGFVVAGDGYDFNFNPDEVLHPAYENYTKKWDWVLSIHPHGIYITDPKSIYWFTDRYFYDVYEVIDKNGDEVGLYIPLDVD